MESSNIGTRADRRAARRDAAEGIPQEDGLPRQGRGRAARARPHAEPGQELEPDRDDDGRLRPRHRGHPAPPRHRAMRPCSTAASTAPRRCSRSTPSTRSAPGRRVFSEDTSYKMRALLRLVVTKGTGKKADAPGYRVGGKTGTAEKYHQSLAQGDELRRRLPDGRAALRDRRDARRAQGDRRDLRLQHRGLEHRAGVSAAPSAGSRRCSACGPTRSASRTWPKCFPTFTKKTN